MSGRSTDAAPDVGPGVSRAPDALPVAELLLFAVSAADWLRVRDIVLRAHMLATHFTLIWPSLQHDESEHDEAPSSWLQQAQHEIESAGLAGEYRAWPGQSFEGIVREAVQALSPRLIVLSWPGPEARGGGQRFAIKQLLGRADCRILLAVGGERSGGWAHVAAPTTSDDADEFAREIAYRLADPSGVVAVKESFGGTGPDGQPEGTAPQRGLGWRAIRAASQQPETDRVVAMMPLRGIGPLAFPNLSERFIDEMEAPALLATPLANQFVAALYRPLAALGRRMPSLSEEEKVLVYRDVRRAARSSADFRVLIVLAAIIAVAGLLADNAAVVIGGMLVAPLMSPIVAVGLGVVEGDIRVLKLAGGALWSGSLLILAISAVAALTVPGASVTAEIAARAHPTLLDLGVAVAAGAAATYGVCRRSAAAALPGVAVAAALLPPLASAAISGALGDFRASVAAGLLFGTNVTAIAAASAVTFVWLGFEPERERVGRVSVVGRGAVGLAAVVLLLGASLVWLAVEERRSQALERQAATAIALALPALPPGTEVTRIERGAVFPGYVRLRVEIRGLGAPTEEQLQLFHREAEAQLGRPIDLVIEVTPALRLAPSVP